MLTLEMVLVLPILLVVAFAIIVFGMMLMSSQAVGAAAHLGVREATLPCANAFTVADAVNDALEGWSFQNDVEVVIFVNDMPEGFNNPLAAAVTGDKVSVTVRVGAAKVAPNALLLVGISIADTELQQTFVMRKE